MPWKSRWNVDLPVCSLPAYLFGSPTEDLGSKAIFIDGEQPEHYLTLTTYRDWSKRFAAGLKKNGFKRGDRLLLFSGNTIFYCAVLQGTVMAGGIFTGANPNYVAREITHQLKDSGATFLLVGEMNIDTALEAVKELNFPTDKVFIFDDGVATMKGETKPVKNIQPWTNLIASPEEGSAFRWENFDSRDKMNQTCVLNYSSGTTGVPKGVEITHMNYISNCVQVNYTLGLKDDFKEWQKRAKGIAFLPMYHAYGQTYFGANTPLMGLSMYVMRKFDFPKFLQWIQDYKITELALVPPIIIMMSKSPATSKFDLSTLEDVICGAAPLSEQSANEFETKFKNKVKIRQGWGMTEVTCSAVGWHPSEPINLAAVGELNANVEARIVDESDKEVAEGSRGEIHIRAPNVCKGYWNRPEATRETITSDGWLRTGDIGYRNSEGFLFVVDRMKELIKVKGLQVAPAELEGVLLDHPDIVDVGVVGVTFKDEEYPRAYVVLKEGSKVAPKEVAAWLAERVSRHKRLDGGVVVLDAIPKNPSGKLLRKELRDRAKKEVGDRDPKESRL